jgi:heat-inducible transcriptional repressor
MRVDYKKIIPYVEYLTQRISSLMDSGDDDIINAPDNMQEP